MPFGIPSATDLSGLATQLGTIVANLGPEESAVVTGAISQLSDHATALETKLATDAQALENPLIAESQKWRAFADRLDGARLIPSGGAGSVTPFGFTLLLAPEVLSSPPAPSAP